MQPAEKNPFAANETPFSSIEGGQEYLDTTSIVEDPQYLYAPWVVSNQFRREADGSKWDPQPCELILPAK